MIINAPRRNVSHFFETFVPSGKSEELRRLVDMASNDTNSWNPYGSVGPSPANAWVQGFDCLSNNEGNPQAQDLYGGYFPNVPAFSHELFEVPKHNRVVPAQCQLPRGPASSQQTYQQPIITMRSSERHSPMRGSNDSQWSINHGHGNFPEFSSAGRKESFCQSPLHNESSPYNLTDNSESLAFCGKDDSPFMDVYSGYSSPTISITSKALQQVHMSSDDYASSKSSSWLDNLHTEIPEFNGSFRVPFSNDELPRHLEPGATQHRDYGTAGTTESVPWRVQPDIMFSDRSMFINPEAAMSSSGLSQGQSDSTSTTSVYEELSDLSGPESLEVVEQPRQSLQRVPRLRRLLPDAAPESFPLVPMLPSNDFMPIKSNRRRPTKIDKVLDYHSQRTRSPTPIQTTSCDVDNAQTTPTKLERATPKPVIEESATPTQSWVEKPLPATTSQATHHRSARDDFLVKSKLAGMPYKEIRKKGGFTEAESTLRGRFRTLTKQKAARVRKPEWTDNDVRLLKKAVRKLTSGNSGRRTSKVPWKAVGEYIQDNGGSYHFGNATCRKRWDELQAESQSSV